MSEVTRTKKTPESITQGLSALRRKISTWILIKGLSRVFLVLIGLVAVDLLIDWFFHMDNSQRAILLVLMVAVVIWSIWHFLIKPLSQKSTDDALILEVEGQNKELKESIISAMQFSRSKSIEKQGVSTAMVDATIQHGGTAASQIKFGKILDSNRLLINMILLVVGLGAIGFAGYQISDSDSFLATWFDRNVRLKERAWPQKTYLKMLGDIKDGELLVTRGVDFLQQVEIESRSEIKDVEVFMEFDEGGERRKEKMKSSAEGELRFETLFKNVSSTFRFRAVGGDARTPWVRIKLVEAPGISDLQIVVKMPEYTKAADIILEGSGPHSILNGSSIQVNAKPNKELSKAILSKDGKTWDLNQSKSGNLMADLPSTDVSSGVYEFDLEDLNGKSNKEVRKISFAIKIKKDRAPRVRARLDGVSGLVVPKAQIPISIGIQDDYSVTKFFLTYNWKGDNSDSVAKEANVDFVGFDEIYGPAEISLNPIFDLELEKIPAGASFRFVVNANDNCAVSEPNTGKSTEFLLRVVTEDELRTDLLRREKEQREQFQRLIKEQEELLLESESLEADSTEGIKDKVKYFSDIRKELIGFKRSQKLLGSKLMTIAGRFSDFLIEAQNNRLDGDGKLRSRLNDGIVQPMRLLAQGECEEAIIGLESTRREIGKSEQWQTKIVSTVAAQKKMVAEMNKILAQMVKSESYQEAVALLREMKDQEIATMKRAMDRRSKSIEDIFNGQDTGNDDEENKDDPEKKEDEKE